MLKFRFITGHCDIRQDSRIIKLKHIHFNITQQWPQSNRLHSINHHPQQHNRRADRVPDGRALCSVTIQLASEHLELSDISGYRGCG